MSDSLKIANLLLSQVYSDRMFIAGELAGLIDEIDVSEGAETTQMADVLEDLALRIIRMEKGE